MGCNLASPIALVLHGVLTAKTPLNHPASNTTL